MDQLILLAIITAGLPLVSFILVGLNQRWLNQRAHLIAIPTIAFSLVLASYVAWLRLRIPTQPALQWSFDWVHFGHVGSLAPVTITQGVSLDNLSAILMVVVTLISLLVHVFSIGYMKKDTRYARYYAYLGLFTAAMLVLVLADNLLGLFIAWEIVGFASYILIGHWHERKPAQAASIEAFMVNRVGDVGFWIGILLLYAEFHTFNLRHIFSYIHQGLPISFSIFGLSPEATLTAAGLLLFAGAAAKSAQFPFHIWLPDAMEGPTPVSALIHAATMVAAGVYLTARIFPILTAHAMLVIAIIGGATSILAATIALAQSDIKRVLAYSTLSQLGLMIMAIGAGAVAAGLFHLVTHAMFKAALFLGAGSVISAMHSAMREANDHTTDAQDICNMGGLIHKMPITAWTFILASLALIGIPLFSGFLSKDEILAGTAAYGTMQGSIATALPTVGLVVAFMTALYMGRLVFRVFFGARCSSHLFLEIRESPRVMTVPLIVLATLSLWFCFARNPLQPAQSWMLASWLRTPAQVIPPQLAPVFSASQTPQEAPATENNNFEQDPLPEVSPISPATIAEPMPHQLALRSEAESLATRVSILSVLLALFGLATAWVIFLWKPFKIRAISTVLRPISRIVKHGFYLREAIHLSFAKSTVLIAIALAWFDRVLLDGLVNALSRLIVLFSLLIGWLDRYLIDGIVNVIGATIQLAGLSTRTIQTGRIQTYMFWAITGMVILLGATYAILVGF